MAPIKIIKKPSPNRTPGRQKQVPDIIVCHITDGTFPGSVSWVTNPVSRVSYHFMVSLSGEIYQTVDIKDTAWANGTTNDGQARCNSHSLLEAVRSRGINANLYTISIGFEGRHVYTRGTLSPKQFNAAVDLIKHIRAEVKRIWRMDIPLTDTGIVGHKSITPRHRPNCPGVKFPFDDILASLAGGTEKIPRFLPGHIPEEWAKESWLWAMAELGMDGMRPRDTLTRQEVMTLLHRFYNGPVTRRKVSGDNES